MAKENKNIANSDILSEVIVLRSVYGKMIKYYIQPCKDPKTGRFPDHVKPVDSHGDIRLSDKEKNEEGVTKHFIKETDVFVVQDGTTFDLKDMYQKAEWEAIKNSILIAPSRTAKDKNGNLLIDGTTDVKSLNPRYGQAELYVDRPGLISQQRVSKKKKYRDALTWILDDERGYEGRVTKAKVLGRDMKNQPDMDVTDFLCQVAEKDPDKIIALYTGDDLSLRILFIDAKDKRIINYKNKAYNYGENILAATDEAVLTWMKNPRNAKILEMIRKDTYPELYTEEES